MRLARYEARTSALMTVLALLFLAVYANTVIATGFPSWLLSAARTLNWVIWAAFAIDLAVRLGLAEDRARWLLSHPVDVASVVLPALRPLRVLRVFTAGQSLLARRGGLLRTGQAVVFTAAVLVLVGALAELDAERGAPGATIVSFGDALWWAMTTITTVGYGDLAPVTTEGRLVAAALMVVGISVLGVITASVAAWFVEQTQRGDGAVVRDDDVDRADADRADRASAGTGTGTPHDHRAQLHALRAAGVLTAAEVETAERRLET